eukprot:7183036-Prymnesium_polylepis.1
MEGRLVGSAALKAVATLKLGRRLPLSHVRPHRRTSPPEWRGRRDFKTRRASEADDQHEDGSSPLPAG